MRAFVTLVRRELGGFFVSLTGYVIIASVLLLVGFSLTDMLVKLSGEPTDTPITELFYGTVYFWLILLITAPVITMRTFALEKYSGTFETLMTTPVSDVQVVLAKFFGALIFYAITWSVFLACILVVRYYTNEPNVIEPRALGSTALGMLLIGCLYMALGCFGSSLTRSQIMAAMNSLALGLTLFLLSLRTLMPSPPMDWKGKAFAYISMIDHMQDFSRGFVDTRHVVFYLSLTMLFLFLTWKVVESRRWK